MGALVVGSVGGWSWSSEGAPVVISDEDRVVLERWSKRPKTPMSVAQWARIVLLAAEGLNNTTVAERVGVNQATVVKWRKRYVAGGVDGLIDEPRPGAPRKITDTAVEEVVVRTLEETPVDATHWSTRDLARRVGMSASSVGRIWQAFGLRPWLTDTFKLSGDPQFIDKVRDVVGIYMDPPDHAVVLCVDEKTGIGALDRTRPVLAMRPGQVERRTHDYVRHGVTDLFAALNVATGQVIARTDSRHRSIEFIKFLDLIDDNVPADLDVHVVVDNASTHKTPAVHTWLLRHRRFTFHFTPTSSSWLNLVERWFAELTSKLLRRGAHRSVRALNADIRAWIETWNENPRPYVWTKPAEQILESIARYCQRINQTGH
jgi:transposase